MAARGARRVPSRPRLLPSVALLRSRLRAAGSGARRSGLWTWIKDNDPQIKIVFAVLAGLSVLMEYRAKDYLDRVKNASEQVEKYYGSENHLSLLRLEDLWLSEEVALRRRQLNAGLLHPAGYRGYVADRVSSHHRADFLQAVRGLNNLSICAIQGRCEPSTMCMYVAQRVQDFRCNFRETIAEMSDDNGSCIVDAMNHFVDQLCGKWVGRYMGAQTYRGIEDNECLYDRTAKASKIGKSCTRSLIHKETAGFLDRFLR